MNSTTLTFQDIREGAEYTMSKDDYLNGKFYNQGDRVVIIAKTAGQPFYCKNIATGIFFYISGASSFQ